MARKKTAQPDSAIMKEVLELNRFDVELYEFAKELYEKQKAAISGLDQKVSRFKLENNWFWRLNPAYTSLKNLLGLTQVSLMKK